MRYSREAGASPCASTADAAAAARRQRRRADASPSPSASACSSGSTGCSGSHIDGSGLGLAIVREIAALHGAEIALDEDADGVGNTFSVSFPRPADAPATHGAAA